MEQTTSPQQAGLLPRAFLWLSVMGTALLLGLPWATAAGFIVAEKLASVPSLAGIDLASQLGNASLTTSAGIAALVGVWSFARGVRCGLRGGSLQDEPLHVQFPFVTAFLLSSAATALLAFGSRSLPGPLMQLLPFVGGPAVLIGGLGVLASFGDGIRSVGRVLIGFGSRTTARAIGLGMAAPVLAVLLSGATAPILESASAAADRAVQALERQEGESRSAPPLLFGGVAATARLPERRQADPVFDSCIEELTAGSRGQIEGAVAEARRSLAGKVGAADAEDISMEVLIEVCVRHSASRLQELRVYYFGSVRNAVYRRTSESLRRSRLLLLQGSTPERCQLSPEAAAITNEEHRVLRDLLAGLLEDDRRLLLASGSGRRYRDIAAELGITETAARKRVQRLTDRLAVEFHERCR